MIPYLISTTHITEALRRIIRDGVPSRRRSTGYCLVVDDRHFPPKYTISISHQVATGNPLSYDKFHGGREANLFLRERGFSVIKCKCCGRGQVAYTT